ncbi:patatin-like phospholipase family protein [Bacillus piscicola]|uniref:patatin-like phospholipase family protein n=1 Tax=Bacillus piscicola TaxID=1632684 RepID=UPI001F09726E
MTQHRPSIGLALGAGGVRGFAHIGVIDTLNKHNIPIDTMTGSSMGGLIASLYGAGQTPETMEAFARYFKRRFYLDFTVPKLGFVQGERVKELIHVLSKKKNLQDMELPVGIVAADLQTGESVLFRDGPAAEAVRASISIPGIFVPAYYRGRMYVDGGVTDLVPVQQARLMGADLVIAVDVSFYNTEPAIHTIYDVIVRTMDIMGRQLKTYKEGEADFLIKPISSYQHSLVFENVDTLIQEGKDAAEKVIPLIIEKIKQWKGT